MTVNDSLADLLTFPYAPLVPRARACAAALRLSNGAAADAVVRFCEAIQTQPQASLQEDYTDTFDLEPACSLELGWHLFGDTHDRGGFLAVLRDDLRQAGVEETAGLPDHLAHLLSLVARES
jgi:nitrate reductase delta subunit